ncbi:unnamed protein product [Closterium sp. Naga37s-1]|nr:unnamed protein product [Closterium sp. Naga37s-1]
MRSGLCAHAAGTLIPALQRQGLRIPLQPVPVIDDDGYMCVDPPVDQRRELLEVKGKVAVLEHDFLIMTAKIEFLAISKGVTSAELEAGARDHMGAVNDTTGPQVASRKAAKVEETADHVGQVDCARPRDGLVPAHQTTPAPIRPQERGTLALAVRGQGMTHVHPVPGNPGRASSSGRTGVMWNAEKQRFYVRIISGQRKQVRLGSYEDPDEAAYAYAAGAVVLRPNSRISCTVELSEGERQALEGCTEDNLRLLVKFRRWNRWREWRAALEGLEEPPAAGARSRRKGTVSRDVQEVEEVDAATQNIEEQAMADEPESPPQDYSDDDETEEEDEEYVAVHEVMEDEEDEEDD